MKKWFLAMLTVLMIVMVGCSKEEKATPTAPEYNYTTQEILDTIKDAMGEAYLPNMPMDEQMITELMGIDLSLVEEFVAESPMISINPDKVIIMKAKKGKQQELLALLEKVKTNMIENTFTYPQSFEKVQATKLVHQGDYMGILMLGDANNEEETEEARLQYAEEQVKVAVDAFNSMFNK